MDSQRLNVCMYTPSAAGGHARYTHELLEALAEVGEVQGVRPSLVTSTDLDPKYRDARYRVYDILPPLIHRSAFHSVLRWALSRVRHYYDREKTFLRWVESHADESRGIHFQEYTPWLAPQHFRWLKARKRKLFLTVHNIYPHRYMSGVIRPLYKYWIRLAWRQCDALFVHTEDLRERLAEFLGTGHPPLFVTPHGVWTAAGTADAKVASVEERISLRRLLFFGVIRRNKGLPVLLRAMESLSDCTLTVAGAFEEPRYREQIRSLVERLPPGQVELLDRFVEDEEIVQLFGKSTLVILPYTSFAAQSGVLHDALAHGLPVVASDVGTLGESVRRWGIGEVVPPDDNVTLVRAICDMLVPHRYVEASRAVDEVRKELSWKRTAQITIKAYRTVGLDRTRVTRP